MVTETQLNNLKPFNKRTESEQREIARKGGQASGRRRRFAKSVLEAIDAEMERKTKDGQKNGCEALGAAIMAKAVRGDIQAARLILELRGELNKSQKVEISGSMETTERKEMSVTDAKKMLSELNRQYGLDDE